MARRDVGAHAMEIGSAAAADVQDRFIAAPMEMGQAPCRKGGMALIHARQHLLPASPVGLAGLPAVVMAFCRSFSVLVMMITPFVILSSKSYHDVTVRERVGGPELENVQNFVRI